MLSDPEGGSADLGSFGSPGEGQGAVLELPQHFLPLLYDIFTWPALIVPRTRWTVN